jgi:hypothetical protein
VIGTLYRPRGRDHGARRRHAASQHADGVGRHASDGRCPRGIFWLAVGLAHHVRQHPLEAGAIFCEKFPIVHPFADQDMNQRKQHRSVGVGAYRNPFGRDRFRPIVTNRTDVDDLNACVGEFREPAAACMRAEPTFRHLHVLRIGAAEQHHESRMARDRRPGCQRTGHRLRRSKYMGQKGEGGTETVVGCLVNEAAEGG